MRDQVRSLLPELLALIVGLALTVIGSAVIGATDFGLYLLIGAGVVIAALLVLTRLEIGLYVLILFVFLNLSDVLKEAFGIPSVIRPLVVLIFISVMQGRIVMQRKPFTFRIVEAAILLHGLVIFLSLLNAIDPWAARERLFDWARDFVIVLIIVQLADQEQAWKRMQWVLIGSAALLGGLSLFQTLTGSYENTFWGLAKTGVHQITDGFDSRRITGPLEDPNFYAQSMLMIVPLAAYRALTDPRRRLRQIAWICTGLIVAAVILTYSRAAFVVLFLLIGMIVYERRIDAVKLLIAGGLVFLATLPILPAGYLDRIMTLDDAVTSDAQMQTELSFRGRTSQFLVAFEMFFDYPLLGVGAGSYPIHYQAYASRFGLEYRSEERKPHSLYLEIAAERGVIGLAAFAFMLWILFRSLWRAKQSLF